MRLAIRHTTSYAYDGPVPYGLQQIRLTPKSGQGQTVHHWETVIEGGRVEVSFIDQNRNLVQLATFDEGTREMRVHSRGEVEVAETNGIVGAHGGFMPLWLFERSTPLTRAGQQCRQIVASVRDEADELTRLHRLSHEIGARIEWLPGISNVAWTAEEALAEGRGVCQDHAHAFIACARALGHPARYVSGYLLMEDQPKQDATHAWAEAHIGGLGWVGFDVSNGICPDERYVRAATGLDYAEAAPIHGTRYGAAEERLAVSVEVEQVQQ
ncbi:transglutaminase family protein [Wenxinia marina]|uniref:Transglutaminase-like enzyme, putative cysteine protease n=1 Tax=Wenxinia marina DSM 24838 TaxID=1123501 RepID=A0A0D0Q8V3_9RHOB|nr:transglutaminase family protein [Wenxinia marina]KIQ68802.1 Transglutaminase-like enzyme, putative cysteine protease [Wenxinia marina DSM 24838]GGL65114.1 transglutaminase [Wenxinia marina]